MIQYFKNHQSSLENKCHRVLILFIIYIYSSLEGRLSCGTLKAIWFQIYLDMFYTYFRQYHIFQHVHFPSILFVF